MSFCLSTNRAHKYMPYFAFCFWFFKPDHQSKLCPMPHSLHHPSLFILSHLFNWVSRPKRATDTVVTGADFRAAILNQTKILLGPDNKVKHNTARLKQTAKRLIRCGRSNNEYRSQFSERDFFLCAENRLADESSLSHSYRSN